MRLSETALTVEDLAALVREEDPVLDTILLEPRGGYQTRTVALDGVLREVTECFARGFRNLDPGEFPTLFCAWGKCRVGSTALNNLFGMAGLPSYYQPVKAIARQRLTERDPAPWLLPSSAAHPYVFIKETAGPYLLAECLFIPLQQLIDAGYPASKLHLIILDRQPADSLASWIDKWSSRAPEQILARNYMIAALNVIRVRNHARRHGVKVTHYVYEASREPVTAAKALFRRLGLSDRFTDMTVTEWNEKGQLGSDQAKIIFPEEPDIYTVPGLHWASGDYSFRARRKAPVADAHLALLEHCGIQDIYRESVAAGARDLGFDFATSARMFGPATQREPLPTHRAAPIPQEA
jgi:hypothetical protein